MELRALVADLEDVAVLGDASVEVTSVTHDSRDVRPGALFCCVPGAAADGHDFAAAAVASGAVALLAERPCPVEVPQVLVPGVRVAMGPVAARASGFPSAAIPVVGVTGTNGKTTTTHLLASILERAEWRCGVLGTLSGVRTTPEAPELQQKLATWRDEGVDVVAMEVSSHALSQHRVDGTSFAVGVFTNLSPDHLDHHGDLESYFAAKARLFTPELCELAVINLDDSWGQRLAGQTSLEVRPFQMSDAEDLHLAVDHSALRWRGHPVRLALPGRFNVANALGAAEAALSLGLDEAVIAEGLSLPVEIPGRFQRVEAGQPFTVVVDYAHTPDGLAAVLDAARELAAGGSTSVVFGCGGERDTTKRPLMGEVAARRADRVFLTADNSRGEPTGEIIAAVREGLDAVTDSITESVVVEPDRRAAIALAVETARPGDVLVIAGKGHETTQDEGGVVRAFDDSEVARDALAGQGWT